EPDLMHPDMGSVGHVTCLARQEKEYAHRFAIRNRRHVGRSALGGTGLDADADGGQCPELAETPSKRDRGVDRTAAGIQHDGRAAELSAAREFIEISWSIGRHDADRADPAT